MASARDVRARMRSVAQTLQVTKAMKLISTAKLRKARALLEDAEPFFDRIRDSMRELAFDAGSAVDNPLFALREGKSPRRSAVVVMTSDRGMAGGYNAAVARFALDLCAGLPSPFLVVTGAVGQRYLIDSPYPILENFSYDARMPTVADAKEIADFMLAQFRWEVFDEVHIAYTRMRSAVRLVPESIRLLPLDQGRLAARPAAAAAGGTEPRGFEYLPDREAVFDALAPLYLKGVIYGSLAEAYASEQAARMAAMEESTKNAEEMLADLRVAYNRTRQAAITREIAEITAGAATIGG